MSHALFSQTVAVADIDPATRHGMFALYAHYYEPALAAVFEADLAAKSDAILLRDEGGTLRGFSTLRSWRIETPSGLRRVVFSGDTIIEKAFWGTQTLPLSWIEHAGRIKASDPDTPLYWFLITKGHRTYRLLPAFALAFHPTRGRETPAAMRALMNAAGRETFGARFCPETGIVRHAPGGATLRSEFAGTERLQHPDAAFFAERNPGHGQGDELLCFCELSPENLRLLARAKFLEGYERGRLGPHPQRRAA